jgi:hypothetical protein
MMISLWLWLQGGVALAEDVWTRWKDRSGPIPVVNQSPIQSLFLQPEPDRANMIPAGHGAIHLNTTLTNTLVAGDCPPYAATLDLEAVRTALSVTYGFLPRIEVALSLPVIHHYPGFMDRLILDVEQAVGSQREIRGEERADEFTYVVKKDNKVLISGSNHSTGIGDLTLMAKTKIWNQGDHRPTLSARACLKLPTGDEDRAFGSGETDWGLGLLLEKDLKALSLYLNADVTFPGEAFDDAGFSLREFYTIMFGVEYRFRPRWSVLSQLNYLTRPFEHTNIDLLDKRIFEILVGLHYQAGEKIFIQAGGVEDIFDSANASADFTFFINVGLNF